MRRTVTLSAYKECNFRRKCPLRGFRTIPCLRSARDVLVAGLLALLVATIASAADRRINPIVGGGRPSMRLSALSRGINITRWFSAPELQPIQSYQTYITPEILQQLKSAGFTYVRLPLSPMTLQQADGNLNMSLAKVIVEQIKVAEHVGLGVMLQPQEQKWKLSDNQHDQKLLIKFWQELAPLLRGLNKDLTFVEILNEPAFKHSADWDSLQLQILHSIRVSLQDTTVIATGTNWASIDGLRMVHILPDQNIIYEFHFYDPPFLTSVNSAQELPAEDQSIFRHLPFPVNEPTACFEAAAGLNQDIENRLKYYCQSGWTAARVKTLIHQAAEWGRKNRVFVTNTEFGIYSDRPVLTRLAYLRAVREACEADGVGWGLWGYDDEFGFGIHPDKTDIDPLNPNVLVALGLR